MFQVNVEFTDGGKTWFVSEDGQLYYEHRFPEKNARTHPFRYSRRWLKNLKYWDAVKSIEFTEREG